MDAAASGEGGVIGQHQNVSLAGDKRSDAQRAGFQRNADFVPAVGENIRGFSAGTDGDAHALIRGKLRVGNRGKTQVGLPSVADDRLKLAGEEVF